MTTQNFHVPQFIQQQLHVLIYKTNYQQQRYTVLFGGSERLVVKNNAKFDGCAQ